jgi:hypothetical protein
MVRIVIVSPPLSYGRRKIDMVCQDVKMLMAREGIPNCMVHIEDVGGTDREPAKPDLILACNNCPGSQWTASSFTPCPKCGGKMSVHKVVAGEGDPAEVQKKRR